ncbi:type IX secretion/gliding motility protein PorT/SprT [Pontibacter arcticus]|uniref:PorT family protein n=1 Tax=Pontibacter arcticus TaxID=2080288 RepID=A0A364RH15_9BACT|nr:porin family protein [Pontibacter arcticus]RAU83599.1 PorT family protein [Pontibacter arcticus]
MAFTHIRDQFDLHRYKIIVLAFLLLSITHTSIAQTNKAPQNKPGYDDKLVHYGFYLAMPLTKYNLEHSQWYADQLALAAVEGSPYITANTKSNIGFYTGLVLNVRLADYLDARFVPGVGFYGRQIAFTNTAAESSEEDIQTLSSTMIELPLLLKYKAKRRGNFRMYFVGGIKPGIDMGSLKNSPEDAKTQLIQTKKFDLALEYGVGLDIFYPYFKFAPELRFSHGLMNMHDPLNDDLQLYDRSIQKLKNHNVSLILFFE